MKHALLQTALVLLLMPAVAPAQEQPAPDPEPAASAAPPPAEPEAEEGEALVLPPSSLEQWDAVRRELLRDMEEMRNLNAGAATLQTDEDLLDLVMTLDEHLTQFVDLIGPLAPGLEGEAQSLAERARVLADNLTGDYLEKDWQQYRVTMRLLQKTLGELESLAIEADAEMGRESGAGLQNVPADWGDLRFPATGMRGRLVMLDAEELQSEARRRAAQLREATRVRLRSSDDEPAREIGEIARAMLRRQGEFPALSREGYTEAVLRVEVIADNLASFVYEDDRLKFRRQLIELEEALAAVDAYIEVRERLGRAGSP